MTDEFDADSGAELSRDEADENDMISVSVQDADLTEPGAPFTSEGDDQIPGSAGSDAGPTGSAETPESVTIEDLLERAFALQAPVKVQDVRDLLRTAIRAGMPPGEMRLLEAGIGERADWPASVIAQMTKDERNHLKGFGYVSTIDDAADAYSKVLKQNFEELAWVGGSLYGYRPPASPDEDPIASGFFVQITPDELADYLFTVFRGMPIVQTKAHRQEVLKRVQAKFSQEEFFDDAPSGVNLANGFLTWDHAANAPKLFKHRQGHKARCRLAVEYRRRATAPVFLEGLRRTLPDPQKVAALQEAAGAILFGITPKRDAARRMIVLHGPRNSGKSTLISVLKMMVPDYAIASVPPEDWSEAYNRARLEGVMLNIVTELGGRRIVMGDQLKRIVSCEPVSARHPYGRTFEFTPVAWHLFATNELPHVDDRTHAFERRVLAIGFDRSLERAEIDGDFLARVEDELPGILNWAAEGAARLIEREHFTIPPGHDEAVLTMQFGTDVIEHFARLEVEAAPDNERGISAVDLRNAFVAYAEARGVDTERWTDTTGMRRLTGVLKELYGTERRVSNGRPFWQFIRLRNTSE